MGILNTLRSYFQRYKKSEIQGRSAALAFHTLLAIVPVIGLIFWYLKHLGVSRNWFNLIRVYLLSQLNVNSDSRVIVYFDRLTQPVQGHSWGWIGLILIFYTSWNLMNKLGESLDRILDTSPNQHFIEKRGWIKLHIRRMIALIVLPSGLMTSLLVAQWIKKDSWFRYLLGTKTVGPLAALPIAWGVDIVALFLIYYFIPRSRIPPRQAFKAALFAGPVSEIVKDLIGRYSHYLVALNHLYGIFIVIPLFILWMQIAWMIILVGTLLIHFSFRPLSPQ